MTKVSYSGFDAARHEITTDRPRLLGSRQYLRDLAKQRPHAYQQMVDYARQDLEERTYELQAKMYGLAIAYVIEGNKSEGRKVVDLALKHYIDKPIQVGHVTFAHDLAKCAIAYDLCHDLWTAAERERFRKYVHATIDANHESEPSVFHNGWYGYKHWGYGMAGYALMHDDPEAGTILKDLERDYLNLAAPGLRLAGNGGGWAEGYYIHFWLFEWMFFCEVARTVEGLDYYAAAPEFFDHRATAAMFEFYPPVMPPSSVPGRYATSTVKPIGVSRRPIPMGDGAGRYNTYERDKTLTTLRILVNRHRNDPAYQAIHAFNLQTPDVALACNLYMSFLWNDTSVKPGALDEFKLSHVSPGAGHVYARSSWKEDATHFFFRCGRRFTAHQHLDNGHFLIFKNEELLGDGGHYDSWTDSHVINYYLRTIAHNTLLIEDPSEKWEEIRAVPTAENDGGQMFEGTRASLHQNGGVCLVSEWEEHRNKLEIGRLAAYRDQGSYLYTAGDITKSYSAKKAKCVTRQIVFLRPGTFVIFDRVDATNEAFKKKFLLQPVSVPQQHGAHWVVTQGKGRLFIQTLSPAKPTVELYHGENLYTHGGKRFIPVVENCPAPNCRMEISAGPGTAPAKFEYFLHVLTATDANVADVLLASAHREGNEVTVTIGEVVIRFALDQMKGSIRIEGKDEALVDGGVAL